MGWHYTFEVSSKLGNTATPKNYPSHNFDFEHTPKLNLYGGKPIAGKDYDRNYLPLIPNVTEFKKF